MDDIEPFKIHGIVSSDSDSDIANKIDFDEEYYLFKPPPFDYELMKDSIIKISSKEPEVLNVWEERLKRMSQDKKIEENIDVLIKKKKKRKKQKIKDSLMPNNTKIMYEVNGNETSVPHSDQTSVNFFHSSLDLIGTNVFSNKSSNSVTEKPVKKKRKRKSKAKPSVDLLSKPPNISQNFSEPCFSKCNKQQLDNIEIDLGVFENKNVWFKRLSKVDHQREMVEMKQKENEMSLKKIKSLGADKISSAFQEFKGPVNSKSNSPVNVAVAYCSNSCFTKFSEQVNQTKTAQNKQEEKKVYKNCSERFISLQTDKMSPNKTVPQKVYTDMENAHSVIVDNNSGIIRESSKNKKKKKIQKSDFLFYEELREFKPAVESENVNESIPSKINDSKVKKKVSQTENKISNRAISKACFNQFNDEELNKIEKELNKLKKENIWHAGLTEHFIQKERERMKSKEIKIYNRWSRRALRRQAELRDKNICQIKLDSARNIPPNTGDNNVALKQHNVEKQESLHCLKNLNDDLRCYYYEYRGRNFQHYVDFRELYLYMSFDKPSKKSKLSGKNKVTFREEYLKDAPKTEQIKPSKEEKIEAGVAPVKDLEKKSKEIVKKNCENVNESIPSKINDSKVKTKVNQTEDKVSNQTISRACFNQFNDEELNEIEKELNKLKKENIWHAGLTEHFIQKEREQMKSKEIEIYNRWLRRALRRQAELLDKDICQRKLDSARNIPPNTVDNNVALKQHNVLKQESLHCLKNLNDDLRCYYYEYKGINFQHYVDFRERYLYMSFHKPSKKSKLSGKNKVSFREEYLKDASKTEEIKPSKEEKVEAGDAPGTNYNFTLNHFNSSYEAQNCTSNNWLNRELSLLCKFAHLFVLLFIAYLTKIVINEVRLWVMENVVYVCLVVIFYLVIFLYKCYKCR